jgi:hypothetical protein
MVMRTEIFCHNCQGYFWWDFDEEVNGDYKIICPQCGHDHYRVVRQGVETDERWDQSASQKCWSTVYVPASFYHTQSFETSATVACGGTYLSAAWMCSSTSANG